MLDVWLAIAPLFSALLGGFVVHRATRRRALEGARRAARVEHLIRAYRGLVNAANRAAPLNAEQTDGLETALTDIMLLGERAEVEAASEFIRCMGQGEPTNLDEVLEALRDSLRSELRLDPTPLPSNRILRMIPDDALNRHGSPGRR
ncbi:MAG: hypothetical protein ACOYXW_18570 [Actinomycetota bacterium]